MNKPNKKYTKAAKQAMDQDYTDKLSAVEKVWLDAFNNAEYSGNISELEQIMFVSKKLRKEFSDNNNSRNRDILSKSLERPEYNEELQPATTIGDLADDAKTARGRARNAFRKKTS